MSLYPNGFELGRVVPCPNDECHATFHGYAAHRHFKRHRSVCDLATVAQRIYRNRHEWRRWPPELRSPGRPRLRKTGAAR